MKKQAIYFGNFINLSKQNIKKINDLQAKYSKLLVVVCENNISKRTSRLNNLYRTYKSSDNTLLFGNNLHLEIEGSKDLTLSDLKINLKEWDLFEEETVPKIEFSDLSKARRAELTKTICIVGAESSGKSNFQEIISQELNIPYATEYGRNHILLYLGAYFTKNMHYIANEKDYLMIIAKQHLLNQEKKDIGNKITLIDTDAIFSQYLFNRQFGFKHPLIEEYIKIQNYDHYIFFNSDVNFVQDGIRLSDDISKRNMEKELVKMYLDYGKKLIFIKGNNFASRLQEFRKFITKELEDE